jgi:hypothetical protein
MKIKSRKSPFPNLPLCAIGGKFHSGISPQILQMPGPIAAHFVYFHPIPKEANWPNRSKIYRKFRMAKSKKKVDFKLSLPFIQIPGVGSARLFLRRL